MKIPLQPKQMLLYNLVESSPATWIGYGGSRGGAKSFAARAIQLLRRVKYPGSRGCIYRRTFDLVRENHIAKIEEEYPELMRFYNATFKELRLPVADKNGRMVTSVLAFRSGDKEGAIDAQIGKEYMDVYVDQAEEFSESELTTLKSIARKGGLDNTACKLILTFNPGNIGHAFLQRIFFDHRYTESETSAANVVGVPVEQNYEFIQAYGWDNVEWANSPLRQDGYEMSCPGESCHNPKCGYHAYYSWTDDQRFDYYIKRTQFGSEQNALPPARRIGWLLGLMNKFGGQFFDIFNLPPHQHVRRLPVKEWDTRSIGIDWGYGHNSSIHWGARVTPETMYAYREKVINGLSAGALAQTVVDMTPPQERPYVNAIKLSHDAFAQRDERDTQADIMREVFVRYNLPVPTSAGKNVAGVSMAIYEDLQGDNLYISPDCVNLIRVIPMVTWDRDKESVIAFDGDDPYASLRHLYDGRGTYQSIPDDAQTMAHAMTIEDPVARHWFLQRNLGNSQPRAVVNLDYAPSWYREG